MHFDLKTPCKDCPFILNSSTNSTLRKGRLEEIVDDIRTGSSFICHKTIQEYTDKPVKEQHCAGALIFLEREDNPNQMMRIAERIGFYDRQKLDINRDDIINNDDF